MSSETDRIEADINQSRHRLNDTLDELGSKLSPGQILDEAMGLVKGQAGKFAANLGSQIRDNPLPAVLVAAGVALYAVNRDPPRGGKSAHARLTAEEWENDRQYRSLEQARWDEKPLDHEDADVYHARMHDTYVSALSIKQKAGEAVDDFKRRVRETVDGLESGVSRTRERISQTFTNTAEAVRDGWHDLGDKSEAAKQSAQDMYAQNPIAGGAVALAVGAIIGSFAPLTNVERNNLGDVADKAGRVGADMAERGARAAERVAHNGEFTDPQLREDTVLQSGSPRGSERGGY